MGHHQVSREDSTKAYTTKVNNIKKTEIASKRRHNISADVGHTEFFLS
jgi:hypothetical protein